MKQSFSGRIVDVIGKRIFDGILNVENGKIISIEQKDIGNDSPYIIPGFIDSHVHIESSMLLPAEFARASSAQGTIGVVSDPHEIANVLGIPGVKFMLDNAGKVNFNFCFGAPSCVPSCGPDVETSGAVLSCNDVEELLSMPQIGYLSEMMNFPGVLQGNEDVLAKISAAKRAGKKVDGHAPGLFGVMREAYAAAGITTEHECSSIEEGVLCVKNGMKVLIREGSAARNYDTLIPLLAEYPDSVMFCTDDIHPGDIEKGHIGALVRRSLAGGYNLWSILRAASLNPQLHYNLNWGLLRVGDPATFNIVDSLDASMNIISTFINGKNCRDQQLVQVSEFPNHFEAEMISEESIADSQEDSVEAIIATDGQLYTESGKFRRSEVCKMVVVNRYHKGVAPAVGYIRGFDIKNGAMAASIAHDCHNIVAIGSSDAQIVQTINAVVNMRGGIAAVCGDKNPCVLPLPIAGLMSPLDEPTVSKCYARVLQTIKSAGCMMNSPLITMSFMCLPVIPRLKLTDKGFYRLDS